MPVVGTENDNGALVQAQLAHLVHDGSDLPVQLVHHGSVFFCRSGAFPVGSAGIAIGLADGRGARVRVFFRRNIYRAVGKVGGKKDKHGPVPVFLHETKGFLQHHVRSVGDFAFPVASSFFCGSRTVVFRSFASVGMGVAFQGEAFAVFPEEGGIKAMGPLMVHVPYIAVPAVSFQFSVPGGESPFQLAELSRDVSGLFQQFREEHFSLGGLDACCPCRFLFQLLIGPAFPFRRDDQGSRRLGVGMGVAVVHAHKQGSARRAAILAAVAPGEHDALAGQAVDIGCFHDFLAIAAQHAHAQVIRVNKNDIGFEGRGGCQKRRERKCSRQKCV